MAQDDVHRQLRGAVGFGCGSLLEGRSEAEARRLIHAALDAGISYFDTARMYGSGHAERVLGASIRGRRDRLVVVSKAGIAPVPSGLRHRVWGKASAVARKAGLAVPPPPREPVLGLFDRESLIRSVETSLRALRTDRLDALLLHECRAADVLSDAVQDVLARLLRDGKIRTWGVAPAAAELKPILDLNAGHIPIVQTYYAALDEAARTALAKTESVPVVHSVLAGRIGPALDVLRSNTNSAAAWSATTGVDPGDSVRVGQILFAAAAAKYPQGAVLFSTQKPERIPGMVAAARGRLFDSAAIAGAEVFMRSVPASKTG